jgi:HrpA-like RNA helicase
MDYIPSILSVGDQLNLPDFYTPASDNIEIWDEKIKKGIFDDTFQYPNQLNGQPWSDNFKKLHTNFTRNLESYKDAKNIFDIIKSHQVTLITMGTGAGKTTMMPNIMMHYFAYKKKVAVTIPRRGITETAATFGAELLDCNLGKEVGYKHGSSKDKASDSTVLLYTTDGTIKAKLTSSDPTLNEYQCVIIDEAHERNVNIDILFSLLVTVCHNRPDFKLVIMSATVDPLVFERFFKKNNLTFKHHHVEAKPKYTINKIFLDKQISQDDYPKYAKAYLDQILKLTTDGDIIVFFPTLTPAKKIIDKLTTPANLKKYHGKPCFIAYSGTAPQEEKDLVQKKDEIRKLPYYKIKGYTRCVILTTPAAESSLTTAGNVVYVIEPGYAKAVWYDPTIFADVAAEVHISKASITQRQGRTGRVCNGQAYMLYTKDFFDNLPEYNEPDILKSDLTNDILSIMNLSVTRNLTGTLKFLSNLITPPTIESVEAGVKILYNYSMIDSYGEITDIGRSCIKLSKLGPEIARMVMVSYYFNCMEDIVLLAAMMISTQGKGIKDFIKPPNTRSTYQEIKFYEKTMEHFKHPRGDHFTLIKIIKEYMMVHPLDRRKWCEKFKFSYDLFNNSIEPDLKSIRDSLQNVEFPQMFTHYPPPPKFEKPPRDLIEYLNLHNKKLMDQMFGNKLPQNRFNFQYGGSSGSNYSSRDNLDLNSESDSDSDSELKGGFFSKSFFVEKKNKKNEKNKKNQQNQQNKKNDKTGSSLKQHLNDKLQKIENNFNINENNNNDDNIESSRKSLDIKKTKKNASKSIGLWDVKEDIKINKSHTKRLIDIVRSKYTGKHIKDLDLIPKLKEILLTDPKKLDDIKETNDSDNDDDDDIGNMKDEENLLKDDFYIQELHPEIKTKSDLIDEFNTNQQLTQSLIKLKANLFNPKSEIKIKSHKKSKSKSYKKSHKKILFGQGPKLKLKKTMKRQFGSGEDDDKKIMEEEKKKFGTFIDSISLKTESGILPMFRIFENHDENILACIFYGFYMRLGVNYYKKKYLVKLSKIEATFSANTLAYDNQTPELIIYQNLTLSPDAKMGIVSTITPRIINAFI